MASENMDIGINITGNASGELQKIQKNVDKLQSQFQALGNAVKAIAFSSLVANALKMADAVSDLAKATGLTTAAVLGFSQAVKENGGDAEGAYKAIEKFALTLEDARSGSRGAQDALQEAGLTLKEISNLDVGSAFQAYIQGLGKIDGETKRLSNSNNVLGKSVRSVDFEGVAESFGKYTIANARAAVEAEKVGNMVDNLDKAIGALNKGIISALQPIADFINWLSEGSKTAIAFLSSLAAIALLLVGGPLSKGIQFTIQLLIKLAGNLKVVGYVAGTIVAFLVNAFTDVSDALDPILDKFWKLLGIQTNGESKAQKQAEAEAKLQEELEKARKEAEAKELQIKKASAAVELAAQKQIDATKKSIQQYNEQFDMNTKLMGQTEEQKVAVTTMYDLQQRKIAALLPLQEKLRELQSIPAGARTATDTAEIGATQKAIANVTKQYEAQVPVVQQLVADRIKQMIVERDLAYNAELVTKQYERQQTLADQLRGANDKLKDVEFERSQMTRSPLEKQFAQIQEDARKAALEAGRAFSAQFEDMDLTSDQAKELADGLEQIAQRYKAIADQQSANLTMSRSWEQGWSDAFNSYMDNATNAAQRAGEVFSSVTGNMNSAIDKFVETGKFSFGDLATSIIKDLLKIELKAQATQLFKAGAGGLGSLFSGIGSLFGFAEGGNPPVNKPSIVGEQGPELFVPKTAGTIIPNNQLGAQAQPSITNVYNVNAIDARSVAQFFAENRKTMLSSVQLAQKELPYGNR